MATRISIKSLCSYCMSQKDNKYLQLHKIEGVFIDKRYFSTFFLCKNFENCIKAHIKINDSNLKPGNYNEAAIIRNKQITKMKLIQLINETKKR